MQRRRQSPAGFRPFLALAAFATLACTHVAPAPQGAWPGPLRTVYFEPANDVLVVPRAFALDTSRMVVESVTALGGKINGTLGDTLVMELFYITTRDASRAHGARTHRRGMDRVPDLALIVPTAGVHVTEYHRPEATTAHTMSHLLVTVLLIYMSFPRHG